VSCGEEHTAFVTSDHFLYTIGSNQHGQLGIADKTIAKRNSPTLVEALAD